MRHLALLCLLAVAARAQTAENLASIVGVVHAPATGEHAIGFRVVAQNVRSISAASASGTTPGAYELKGLEPGSYRLVVNGSLGTGFQPGIQRSITLAKGQRLILDLTLPPPSGAISGRVFDEDGHPAQGIRVNALDKRYNRGTLRYSPIAHAGTDEVGVYHIREIPAGRSFIVRADASMTGAESPTDTYFPGTVSPDVAQEIVLEPGQARSGVDIRRIKQPSFCIDGLAESGAGFDSMWWEIARTGSDSDWLMAQRQPVPASGEPLQKFAICGLHNGRYQIGVTTANLKKGPVFRANEGPVVVLGGDVHGLRLRPQAPVTVSGETVWDGEAPAQTSDVRVVIHFRGTLRFGGFEPAEPGVPQSFSVPVNLLPEDYLIDRVAVIRGEGVYVKDVTWDGKHPPGNIVSLGGEKGGGHIRILVRGDGASVTMRVAGEDGQPASNAYVAMIPASAANEAEMSVGMIFGQTDQNGHYAVEAVPPGRYRVLVIAINDLIDGAANPVTWGFDTDPAASLVSMLWAAQARGQEVDIGPNARIELKLERQTLR